ncbi:SMR family transporter [Desulfosporosinus lacus]|uniref:EamA-like transporter family protein n=1 Tax=Desulfosporosinus lacus DSM 15449 TaxID=1121420 RepID=A0A1M6B8D6_9FIRM|nr:SMR family transporter [Desulfosporosinus lacus]SHI45011.1 EamA-like transporter family protein [Desulfosporosinus lacus DSM 15449]
MLLIIISVLLGATGQLLVKIGAKHLELDFSSAHLLQSLLAISKNVSVMSGVVLYGLSFILWVKVLSKVELSYAYPFVGLGYIVILCFSYFVFKEDISLFRAIGTLLIMIGVVFVAQS